MRSHRRRDWTELFSLQYIEDCWKMSATVAKSVHTADADETRRDSIVLSAVWTRHEALPQSTNPSPALGKQLWIGNGDKKERCNKNRSGKEKREGRKQEEREERMRKVFLSILDLVFALSQRSRGVMNARCLRCCIYYVKIRVYARTYHLTSQYSQNLQSRPTATSTTVYCDRLAISVGNMPVQTRAMYHIYASQPII